MVKEKEVQGKTMDGRWVTIGKLAIGNHWQARHTFTPVSCEIICLPPITCCILYVFNEKSLLPIPTWSVKLSNVNHSMMCSQLQADKKYCFPSLPNIQWARKAYAAVAKNYVNSKCYISGQRIARKALFWHLMQHGQGFLMIKYQLLKMYSFSAAGPQSFLNFFT